MNKKEFKKTGVLALALAFAISSLLVSPSYVQGETAVSAENPMLNFILQVRWGDVIGEPASSAETNFDGSIAVPSGARVSLEKTLLFDHHNETYDRIISKKDPVSWKSMTYGHWDGVRVVVSSPAGDNVIITAGANNTIMKTAKELYDLKDQLVQDVGNGKEIVIKTFPVSKNPNYFLKVFWGKVDRESYASDRCEANTEGTAKCALPLVNADGSFKIDSGGKLNLVKALRFEGMDKIVSKSDTEINWVSRIYGGVDGILVHLKLNSSEFDKSDTVTLSFPKSVENGWTKNFSIVDLYHNGYTQEIIKNGYGVVLQVWKRPNKSLIRAKNKSTVYMLEDGIKQPIPSPEVLASQGLTFDDVEVVEESEVETYADGEPVNYADGSIVQEEGKQEVYVVANGEKKHIQDPKAFADLGYNWGSIVKVKPGVLGLYRNTSPLKSDSIHPEGALIRADGTPTVYVIKGGNRVPLSSLQLFNANKYDWNKVLVVSENQKNKFKESSVLQYPDGSLLKDPNGKVYKIDHGKKRWVRSSDDFAKAGYKSEKIISVGGAEINSFEEGTDVVADDVTD